LPVASLQRLDPALVRASVLALVAEDAPSRAIVCAGAGHFARAYVTLTPGEYSGGGAEPGERLQAAWETVSDRTGSVVPDYGFTQAEREVASAETRAARVA
jgi:hypothetical protein